MMMTTPPKQKPRMNIAAPKALRQPELHRCMLTPLVVRKNTMLEMTTPAAICSDNIRTSCIQYMARAQYHEEV